MAIEKSKRKIKLLTGVKSGSGEFAQGSVHEADALPSDLLDTLLAHGSAEYHDPDAPNANADLTESLSVAQAANADLRAQLAEAKQEVVRLKARTGEEFPKSEADKRREAGK